MSTRQSRCGSASRFDGVASEEVDGWPAANRANGAPHAGEQPAPVWRPLPKTALGQHVSRARIAQKTEGEARAAEAEFAKP